MLALRVASVHFELSKFEKVDNDRNRPSHFDENDDHDEKTHASGRDDAKAMLLVQAPHQREPRQLLTSI